jgi:hypothetical protein
LVADSHHIWRLLANGGAPSGAQKKLSQKI